MIASSSLVAGYRFEGNANDYSGNGLNGTVSGATLTTGKFGRCYNYSGSQSITLPNNSGFYLTPYQDHTICGWFKFGTGNTSTIIYDSRNATDAVRSYFVGITNDNTIRCWLYIGSASTSVQTSTSVTKDVWNHFAVTFNRDGLMTLYLNGVAGSSTSISSYSATDLSNTNDPKIGMKSYSGSGINPFIGEIKYRP
jgi:hypothetical protein